VSVPANNKQVLVVLPTLGERLDTLEVALASVDVQRADVDLTLAAVLPASAKKARTLAKKHGALLVDDPGAGMSAAINAGLAARTTEEFYIWLGDDDTYRPGGLATLLGLVSSHDDVVVAFGGCDYVDADGTILWTSKAGSIATKLIGVGPNLIPHPAALIRLDALEAVGGYDEALSLVMDLDVFLKLKKMGRFVSTREVVSAFGWHPGSLTVQDRSRSGAEARMVKRRHLNPLPRVFEPLWEYPVSIASHLAARRLNRQRS
jgi:glycosyltransferase involved in cell wall biosynthesis